MFKHNAALISHFKFSMLKDAITYNSSNEFKSVRSNHKVRSFRIRFSLKNSFEHLIQKLITRSFPDYR